VIVITNTVVVLPAGQSGLEHKSNARPLCKLGKWPHKPFPLIESGNALSVRHVEQEFGFPES
jgi:hypothetical protein